jgi:hypothetical protein
MSARTKRTKRPSGRKSRDADPDQNTSAMSLYRFGGTFSGVGEGFTCQLVFSFLKRGRFMKVRTAIVTLLVAVSCGQAGWISDSRFNWSWNKNDRAKQCAQAGFGKPLAVDPKPIVKMQFRYVLKDAMSAQYDFAAPRKGWMLKFDFHAPHYQFGYLVEVAVNSKNSFGAYEGFTKYAFLFRDNQLVGQYLNDGTVAYGWDD